MICSSTELGLAKLNDGILELDDSIGKLILGKELKEYSKLNDALPPIPEAKEPEDSFASPIPTQRDIPTIEIDEDSIPF